MKNRTSLFSGLALFLSFCLLTGAGKISIYFDGKALLATMLGAEILAFVLPIFLIKLSSPKSERVKLRGFLKISAPSVLTFTLFASIAMAILNFLINYALFRTSATAPADWLGIATDAMTSRSGWVLVLAAFLMVPPLFEELFLRGALFSAHEKLVSTGTAIVFSGLCFALLHGSFQNFIGPLLAGMLYAYFTYSFDCIWPAIFAHVLNNLYFIAILWLTETYGAFGIWKYFPVINLILFLAFLYLALQSLETLLAADKIRHFERSDNARTGLFTTILSPGFIVFLLAFCAKAVFKLF